MIFFTYQFFLADSHLKWRSSIKCVEWFFTAQLFLVLVKMAKEILSIGPLPSQNTKKKIKQTLAFRTYISSSNKITHLKYLCPTPMTRDYLKVIKRWNYERYYLRFGKKFVGPFLPKRCKKYLGRVAAIFENYPAIDAML